MLGRWMSATACLVVLSAAVWTGCSSDDKKAAPAQTDEVPGDDEDAGSTPDAGSSSDAGGGTDTGTELPGVAIKYGNCPTFTPCGGDVTGTWSVTGGCLGEATFAGAKTAPCEGIQESEVIIKASGTVEATASNVKMKTTVNIAAKVAFPKACVDGKAGGNCTFLEIGLTTALAVGEPPLFDTASCASDGAGGCNCSVGRKAVEDVDSAYTVAGNTLTTTKDPARTFDYCVAGNKNTFSETTVGGLPIQFEVTK